MSAPLVVVPLDELLDELEALVRRAVADALAARDQAANHAPSDGEWLDTKAAAALLGMCERNVQAMAKGRRDKPPVLRATRLGRLLRFRRADVVALLERGSP